MGRASGKPQAVDQFSQVIGKRRGRPEKVINISIFGEDPGAAERRLSLLSWWTSNSIMASTLLADQTILERSGFYEPQNRGLLQGDLDFLVAQKICYVQEKTTRLSYDRTMTVRDYGLTPTPSWPVDSLEAFMAWDKGQLSA